jgi:cytosine/adenosine deaminase-related metal-dependent hydrolase
MAARNHVSKNCLLNYSVQIWAKMAAEVACHLREFTKSFCSGLGKMAADRGLHVQTHVSESIHEVEWVKQLEPDCNSYTHVSMQFSWFLKTIFSFFRLKTIQ